MKKQILLGSLMIISIAVVAQKLPIDTNLIDKWERVDDPAISNNGKYASFIIKSSLDNRNADKTLLVKETRGGWEGKYTGVGLAQFANDDKMLVFKKGADSLFLAELGGIRIEFIANVSFYKVMRIYENDWLVYQPRSTKELLFRNLNTGERKSFLHIAGYQLGNKHSVLLEQETQRGDSTLELKWVDLSNHNDKVVWEGRHISDLVFNFDETAVAFLAESPSGRSREKGICYYRTGMLCAVELANDQSLGLDSHFKIKGVSRFSIEGDRIFFKLLRISDSLAIKPNLPKMDVWSYRDTMLQSQQMRDPQQPDYMGVIAINNRKVIQLSGENEQLHGHDDANLGRVADKYSIVIRSLGEGGMLNEWNWNKAAHPIIFLESTVDGKRIRLNPRFRVVEPRYTFSLDQKYLVYYDAKTKDWFSYETARGARHDLTKGIKTNWLVTVENWKISTYNPNAIAGWLRDYNKILLYDKWDIWEVDLTGRTPPLNITNGFGRAKNICFRLGLQLDYKQGISLIHEKDTLLLSAFNFCSKDDGFYRVILGTPGNPEKLIMKPCLFNGLGDQGGEGQANSEGYLAKAKDAAAYLIMTQSAETSPNLLFTTNFRNFAAISNVYPERSYNWLTSELINYPTPDGKTSQAILYKPINFDAGKKYPVIFWYYEKMTNCLHGFINPRPGGNGYCIDIPSYIDNGYIVCTPDISYTLGNPGQCAYNAVVGAANCLMKKPWVDGKHLGIDGHSFGGYETEYIIAHTHLFAAASEACGWSDFVYAYDDLRELRYGVSHQWMYELGREAMGGTLWDMPDNYIRSSPIFLANKVTTPLLMMSNQADDDVYFRLGSEFFVALRRLGRRVWMLQYDGQRHSLSNKMDRLDYAIRMRQFFDHYLKGAPTPKWMAEGIPAVRKGFDDGLELEPPGIEPGPGLLFNSK